MSKIQCHLIHIQVSFRQDYSYFTILLPHQQNLIINVYIVLIFLIYRIIDTENSSLLMIHRHHSLSALDIKRFKSRSLPASPLGVSIRRNGSPSKNQTSKSPTPTPECTSPPIVRFSLGGEVTCPPSFSIPQVANLVANEGTTSRNR